MNQVIFNHTDNQQSFITNTIGDVIGLLSINKQAISRLEELGVFSTNEPLSSITHRMSRFIFCPNEKIKQSINGLVNQMKNKIIMGVQIRTGGNGANSKEGVTFLRLDELPRVAKLIQQLIQPFTAVYLSTDSSYVLNYMNNHTNNNIFYMKDFGRGHSAPAHNRKTGVSALEGAVCDLGVLSFAKSVYITRKSSYGGFACSLSTAIRNIV